MWQRVQLSGLDGPIRGFTFPKHDVLFVLMSDELVARVTLNPLHVQRLTSAENLIALAEEKCGFLVWKGEQHSIYGPDGGDVTLCDHPSGDRMVPGVDGVLLVTGPDEREVRQRIESVRIPADGSWAWAGFSENGCWLIAGEATGIQLFRQVL